MFLPVGESAMNIDVRNKSKTKSITSYRLRKICENTLKNLVEIEKLENPEISVLFVDDPTMKSLNFKYRNVDETTDVLAFPMCDGRFPRVGPNVLGDIVISIPTAKQQAEEHKHSLEKEIVILLIHGFLHLLGYDDTTEKLRKKMQAREKELLEILQKRGVIG